MLLETVEITVERLCLGMFVAALDRPWAGTPFALQGFRIQRQSELTQLRACCHSVYVVSATVEPDVALSAKSRLTLETPYPHGVPQGVTSSGSRSASVGF